MGLLALIADQRGWLSPVRCYIADTVAESLGASAARNYYWTIKCLRFVIWPETNARLRPVTSPSYLQLCNYFASSLASATFAC